MAEKENNANKVEREYVIPLRAEWSKVQSYKRANKAVKAIKKFLVRHMKIRDRDLRKIKIDKYLNEEVWHRGIKSPPIRIKVKARMDGENVIVELANPHEKLKFKKAREEKKEKKGAEAHEKTHKTEEPKPEETAEKKAEAIERQKTESLATSSASNQSKETAAAELTQKFEKESHMNKKHQIGGKVDKMAQVQTKKKDMKSR